MRMSKILVLTLLVPLAVGACTNMSKRQQGALSGGAIGAAGGAAGAAVVGASPTTGAIVGGALGTGGGYLYGSRRGGRNR